MKKRILLSAILVMGVTGLSSTVEAAPLNAPSLTGPLSGNALGAPVSDHTLAHYRGGHLIQISDANLSAELSNNQAYFNSNSGNSISGNAFQGASGIPTVVQNSGNNVIIQSATVLNVQVH